MLEKFGGWPTLLSDLCDVKNLTAEKTESVLSEILSGDADPSQISAFLVALKVKGETTEEITGLVRAMLTASEPLLLPIDAIDIVGTGGSLQRREAALNVSTMAAFIAAASGAVVCKHGNRRASSTSGAFDLLDALGLPVEQTPAEVAEQVKNKNLGFAKGANLGIKEIKTEYIFLNPADVFLPKKCINDLLECINDFDDFAMLAPTYKDEKKYRNYELYKKKPDLNHKIAKKFGVKEVDIIDGTFVIKKSQFNKINFFDENIFIYFEPWDLSKRVMKAGKKMYVCDKIKFEHHNSHLIYNSSSIISCLIQCFVS